MPLKESGRRSDRLNGQLAEYKKSIRQIEKQEVSYEELHGHQEAIQLRLNSALTSLKQIQIIFTRLKSPSVCRGGYCLETLRHKAGELHLGNLKQEYDLIDP